MALATGLSSALFAHIILQGIAEGRVTLAFRRWRRAPPADGSSLRSPVGVLCLDRVAVVDDGDITPEDVRRTGLSPDEFEAVVTRLARIDAACLRRGRIADELQEEIETHRTRCATHVDPAIVLRVE